jgi:hypothetical protein
VEIKATARAPYAGARRRKSSGMLWEPFCMFDFSAAKTYGQPRKQESSLFSLLKSVSNSF